MNPFLSRTSGSPWLIPVSAVSLVLGFMMTLAWLPRSEIGSRVGAQDPDLFGRIESGKIEEKLRKEYNRMSEEVGKLRDEKTRLENAIGTQTRESQVLNESLQETKLFAGLTEVEGPGISIVLRDSEKAIPGVPQGDLTIHDVDVLRVVNELWAAGAEAIAVGNHRVVGKTSVRCVGPVIHVDSVPISSPIRIRAIGDTETLLGAMNLRGGVLDEIRSSGDVAMVQIEKVERHRLPAYTGPSTFKQLKQAEEVK